MRTLKFCSCLAVVIVLGLSPAVAAAQIQKNSFASIFLDKKKIGQVQLTTQHDENGELQELHARATVSFLGATLYAFTQEQHEVWRHGELQQLSGRTDDDGEIDVVSLARTPDNYQGTLNGKPVTLPHDSFPNSLWHYKITDKNLLFNIADLRLMKVTVTRADDTIKWNGQKVPAERFTITGDWSATAWFDANEDFLQGEYEVSGRKVRVVVDP